jgi:hypothetical protein
MAKQYRCLLLVAKREILFGVFRFPHVAASFPLVRANPRRCQMPRTRTEVLYGFYSEHM